jgi:hypothetical protein
MSAPRSSRKSTDYLHRFIEEQCRHFLAQLIKPAATSLRKRQLHNDKEHKVA